MAMSLIKARLYLASHRAHRRVLTVTDALWTGFWLGALSADDLHAIDGAHYAASAQYQTDEHNTRGLMDWEEAALKYFPASGEMLALSVGGGREALALTERGYQVDGYECHPELARYAQDLLLRLGCRSSVRLIERDAAPTSGGPYDGIVVGWSAYMLIPSRTRRVRLLRSLRRLAKPGAPILLSFFTRARDTPRSRIVALAGTAVRRLRRAEPVEIGDDLRPNFTHRFTKAEVASEMREAGFELMSFQPQGHKPHDSGWAVGQAAPC